MVVLAAARIRLDGFQRRPKAFVRLVGVVVMLPGGSGEWRRAGVEMLRQMQRSMHERCLYAGRACKGR